MIRPELNFRGWAQSRHLLGRPGASLPPRSRHCFWSRFLARKHVEGICGNSKRSLWSNHRLPIKRSPGWKNRSWVVLGDTTLGDTGGATVHNLNHRQRENVVFAIWAAVVLGLLLVVIRWGLCMTAVVWHWRPSGTRDRFRSGNFFESP
jgi:hypothetical protein